MVFLKMQTISTSMQATNLLQRFTLRFTKVFTGVIRRLSILALENELTDDEKSKFEGEAKFLRAFFHFEALKLWGTPPLVLETPKSLSELAVGKCNERRIIHTDTG